MPFKLNSNLPRAIVSGRVKRRVFSPLGQDAYGNWQRLLLMLPLACLECARALVLICTDILKLIFHNTPLPFGPWQDHVNCTRKGQWYRECMQEVKSMTPPGNLLDFNVGEGWKPLSELLGHEVPSQPSSRRKERTTMNHNADALEEYMVGTIDARVQMAAWAALGWLGGCGGSWF